jgi:hypothetical protein
MRHSRQVDIADVSAPPGDEADIPDTADRLTDAEAVHSVPQKEQALTHSL